MILFALLGWLRPAWAGDLPAPPDFGQNSPTYAPPARVVMVQGSHLLNAFLPNETRVTDAFNRGLLDLTHAPNATAAWLSLVKTNDVIGLKVFSDPGPLCGTRPALVSAIAQGLIDAGVPPQQIVIWDKRSEDLRAAGYFELGAKLGVQVTSAVQAGFDTNTFYLPDSPVIGSLVWGDVEFGRTNRDVGKKSFVSRLLSQRLTKIISIAPLVAENSAGICGHFYSLALGSVDNTHRFEYNPDRLAVALPEIIALPSIGDHVVLNVTDALICQYEGGPAGFLQFSTVLNQIWLSHDPVALDVLGLHELQFERHQFQGIQPLIDWETYTNAALLQLGQNIPDRIPVHVVH